MKLKTKWVSMRNREEVVPKIQIVIDLEQKIKEEIYEYKTSFKYEFIFRIIFKIIMILFNLISNYIRLYQIMQVLCDYTLKVTVETV